MKVINLMVIMPVMVFTLWSSSVEETDVVLSNSASVEAKVINESEDFKRGACIGRVGDDLVLVTVDCWWCSSVGANRRACDKLKEMQDAANSIQPQ